MHAMKKAVKEIILKTLLTLLGIRRRYFDALDCRKFLPKQGKTG